MQVFIELSIDLGVNGFLSGMAPYRIHSHYHISIGRPVPSHLAHFSSDGVSRKIVVTTFMNS